MNATIKNVLIIAGKNAVNAILTNAALMTMLSGAFNVHTADGWWNIGKATVAVVISREALVWIPKVVKWSTTTDN